MKMTCYLCEREFPNLYPMEHRIGKMNATIYVCRECIRKEGGKNAQDSD